MTNSRVSRGRATQVHVANWFAQHGAPGAQSRPASLPGVDVYGIPGIAPEVKGTERLDMPGFLRQARHNAGPDLPIVVYRPRGYGESKIAHWIVGLSLADFTWLAQQAGLISKTVPNRLDLYQ